MRQLHHQQKNEFFTKFQGCLDLVLGSSPKKNHFRDNYYIINQHNIFDRKRPYLTIFKEFQFSLNMAGQCIASSSSRPDVIYLPGGFTICDMFGLYFK